MIDTILAILTFIFKQPQQLSKNIFTIHYYRTTLSKKKYCSSFLFNEMSINSKTNCSVATFREYVQQLQRNRCYICGEKNKY